MRPALDGIFKRPKAVQLGSTPGSARVQVSQRGRGQPCAACRLDCSLLGIYLHFYEDFAILNTVCLMKFKTFVYLSNCAASLNSKLK